MTKVFVNQLIKNVYQITIEEGYLKTIPREKAAVLKGPITHVRNTESQIQLDTLRLKIWIYSFPPCRTWSI